MVLWYRIKICTSLTCLPRYVSSHNWFRTRNPHHTAQKVAFTPNPHARHLEYSQSTKEICKTMIVNYLPWCMTAIVKQNPLTFRSTRVVIPEEPWILGSCSQSRAHICTLMLCLSENLYHWKLESSCHIISSVCRKCKIIQLKKRYQCGTAKQDS